MTEIVRINRNDLPELALLYQELTGSNSKLDLMENNFDFMNQNTDYILLGIKADSKLVGSLMGVMCRDLVGDCNPFMVIENVIVSGSYRKHGFGRLLMSEIEKIGKERNCHYLMFVSSSSRTSAHDFYVSCGYKSDAVKGFKKYLSL